MHYHAHRERFWQTQNVFVLVDSIVPRVTKIGTILFGVKWNSLIKNEVNGKIGPDSRVIQFFWKKRGQNNQREGLSKVCGGI